MPLFRKKPVVIEAIKFTGINEARQAEYEQFVGRPLEVRAVDNVLHLVIPTLEGDMLATPGDMIIKGVAGEFYPCKPDIFKATYEAEAPATITHAVTLQMRGKHLIADCEAATAAVNLADLANALNIETDRLGRVRH